MSTIASLIVSLRANTGPFSASMRRSQQDFGGLVSTVDSGVARMSGVLGGLAALVGAGGLLASVGTGVKLAADMEQAATSFEVLIGSATQAKSVLEDLQRYADTTPFQFSDVTEASRKLLAMGINAKDLSRTLRMLGDVSSGLGQSLSDIGYLYAQSQSKAHVDATDLKQFAERGIPMYRELATVLHTSTQGVLDLTTAGRVGGAEVRRAFQNMTSSGGQFFGMTEKQGKTLAGLWSTLTDTVRGALRRVSQQAIETFNFKKLIANATGVIDSFANSVVPIVKTVAEWTSRNGELILSIGKVAASIAGLAIAGKVFTTLKNQTLDWVGTLITARARIGDIATAASGVRFGGAVANAPAPQTGTNVAGYAMTAAQSMSIAVGAKNIGMFQKLTFEAKTFFATMRGAGLRAAISDLGLFTGAGGLATKSIGMLRGVAVRGLGAIFSAAGGVVFAIAAIGASAFTLVKAWTRMGQTGEGYFQSLQNVAYGMAKPLFAVIRTAETASDRLEEMGRLSNAAKNFGAQSASATSFADRIKADAGRLTALYAQLANAQKNVASDTVGSLDWKVDTRFVASIKKMVAETTAQLGNMNAKGFDVTIAIKQIEELQAQASRPELASLLTLMRTAQAQASHNARIASDFAAAAAQADAPFQKLRDLTAAIQADMAKTDASESFAAQLARLAKEAGGFSQEFFAAKRALDQWNANAVAKDVAALTASLDQQIVAWGKDGAAADLARLAARGAIAEQRREIQQRIDIIARLNAAQKLVDSPFAKNAVEAARQYQDRLAEIRKSLADRPTALKDAIEKLQNSYNGSMKDRAKELIDTLVTPAQRLRDQIAEIVQLYELAELSAGQMNALIAKAQNGLANEFASKLQQGPGGAIVKGSAEDVQVTYKAQQRDIATEYAKRIAEEARKQTAALNKIATNTAKAASATSNIVINEYSF